MQLKTFEIKLVSISKIYPNNINPNKMSVGAFSRMKISLQEIGQMNPIIVRKNEEENYEIVDGEWRWKAAKELGWEEILCNIINIEKKDIKKYILASLFKGKHDALETQKLVKDMINEEDATTLKACNLDKSKLERRLKYSNISQAYPAKKIKSKMKDEKDCSGVFPIGNYKTLLVLEYPINECCQIIDKLKKINRDLSVAVKELLELI